MRESSWLLHFPTRQQQLGTLQLFRLHSNGHESSQCNGGVTVPLPSKSFKSKSLILAKRMQFPAVLLIFHAVQME